MEEKGQNTLVPKGAASTKSIVDPAVPKDMPSGTKEGPRNWLGLLGSGEVVGGARFNWPSANAISGTNLGSGLRRMLCKWLCDSTEVERWGRRWERKS
jgi:hypothetical protein